MYIITAASTAEATHEATLNDAVQELVSDPSHTLSEVGQFFEGLWKSILGAIPTIIFAVVVLILGLVLTRLSLVFVSKGLDKVKASKKNSLDETVVKFVKQVVKIGLYVLLFTIVLSILGIPSSSIIAVIGTAGVAIGLALQGSLSNVAGGFVLMITKPFKIGDYILVGGVEGTVEQISILHTQLVTGTNQAVFIPNGTAVGATIINNSAKDKRRVDLAFSISYDDDFEKAQEVIKQVLKSQPKVLSDPAPLVRMSEHAASSIVIAVRPWCKTADYWDVYFDTTEKVRAAFIENNISIPFDQLDVHVVQQ